MCITAIKAQSDNTPQLHAANKSMDTMKSLIQSQRLGNVQV